jgi:diguanylate cyclase (GGDEF)-like protein
VTLFEAWRRNSDVVHQFCDASETMLFAFIDASERIVECSDGFRRASGSHQPLAGQPLEDVFCMPGGEPVELVPSIPPTLSLPALCRFHGDTRLFRVVLFAVDGGFLLLGEFVGSAERKTLENLALLTGDLVNISREMASKNRELEAANAKIEKLSRTDELTGLANRRAFFEYLESLLAQAARQGVALSVIMMDIDHFKSINDTYGHDVGDVVLRHVAGILAAGCRREDLAGRFGGEEFVVALPHCDASDGYAFASRVREALEASEAVPGESRRVTASFGVSSYKQGDDRGSMVRRADEALYTAKTRGRNRVVMEQGTGPTSDATKKP